MINPFKSKKGLGRGLSSLIGDTEISASTNKVSISSIVPNKYQPRKNFDKEALDELSKSIKERGVIQPLIVRKSEDEADKFEIIAGERRLQASQNAGMHEVPVIVIEADNLKSLEFAIVENVQRKDLNPIEEAEGYKRLIDEFNYDQEKVSKFIGKSRSHITNCLRLLSLPQKIKDHIINQKISQGHAKILVGIDNAELLADKIISKNLSVRQSENLVRLVKNFKTKNNKPKDPNIRDTEKQLENIIGMRVKINNYRNNKGTISFEYKGVDQLDHIINIVKKYYL